jgi:hypothetical protein
LLACGPPPTSRLPVSPVLDAGTPDAAPVAEAPFDVCSAYALAVGPALARIEASADDFLSALAQAGSVAEIATAAAALADRLDGERAELAVVKTGDAELDAAHDGLLGALAVLAVAVRDFGAAHGGGDPARVRPATGALEVAIDRFGAALGVVQAHCPGID